MGGDRFDDWDDGDPEPVRIDDATADKGASGARRRPAGSRRRVGRGLPTSLAAMLLVGAVALGATTVPIVLTAASAPATCEDEQGNTIECPPDPGGTEPTPTPTATPTDGQGGGGPITDPPPPSNDNPGTDPTDKPKDPKPTHHPHPKPAALGLKLTNVDGGVKVDWTTCKADAFDVYKVVRSTDPFVRWPLGRHDRLVGVINARGTTALIDGNASAGKRVWYRVFCVDRTDRGYKILNSSAARSIRTHRKESTPTQVKLGFETNVTDGGVALNWDACQSDAFRWYKVVRSHGANPSYVPWTDGSQLIRVIENRGTTTFTDTHVESGQTWFYRVQCVGFKNGQKVNLGQTAAIEVTIP